MAEDRQVLGGSTDVLSTDQMGGGLKYPIRGHRFTVNLGGLGLISFKSVEGFSIETSPVEYREGAFASLTMRKIPGLMTYGEITLTKGMYQSLELYDYFMGYMNGKNTAVQQMIIEAYDNADIVVAKWSVLNAWPTHYDSGGLNADSADILIETVTFANEGVFRETV
jgi:phage tail-like protein